MFPATLTDDTLCLGSTTRLSIFNFYANEAEALADLPRANAGVLAPEEGYQVLTYASYKQAERTYYLSQPLTRCTPEHFQYALEVLPPEAFTSQGPFQRWHMMEYQQGVYTRGYASLGEVCVTRFVDGSDPSTWISHQEIDTLLASSKEHCRTNNPAPKEPR